MLHDTELANAVIDMNHRVPHRIRWKKPLVIVSAIGFINDAHAIGLYDTKILEG